MLFNSRKKTRAQTSIEFVFTMALALMLLVPATIVFNRYATDSQQALINTQVHKVGSELIHLSEKMHASGTAWDTVEVTLPGSIKKIIVYNGSTSELVIQYEVDHLSEVVFFSNVPIYNQTGIDCTDGCLIDVKSGAVEIRVESYPGGIVVIDPRN